MRLGKVSLLLLLLTLQSCFIQPGIHATFGKLKIFSANTLAAIKYRFYPNSVTITKNIYPNSVTKSAKNYPNSVTTDRF